MEDQHRQVGALLGTGQRHHTTAGAHLQRPEDAEVHRLAGADLLRHSRAASASDPRVSVLQAAGRTVPTMTTQLTTPQRPTCSTAGPARRRNLRNAAAIAGAAVLIAAGASTASAANGPGAAAPASAASTAVPLAQRLREYRETIIALYGHHPASAHPVDPGTRAMRELSSSVAGQYGQAD
jgi:hypothetical protein